MIGGTTVAHKLLLSKTECAIVFTSSSGKTFQVLRPCTKIVLYFTLFACCLTSDSQV